MSIKFYPVELHTHTLHSDGRFSPQELANSVACEGLIGFALTDHNTSTGTPYAQDEAAKRNLLFIHGIEWTTFYGHITVLGGDFGIDWRTISPSTVAQKCNYIIQQGGCVGIAHPFRIGYPICTGGSDDWGLSDYSCFTHYEVWSYKNPYAQYTNRLAEDRYRKLCGAGNRLACVYGRDWHGKDDGLYAATFVGIDGTPTPAKALDAIRKGKTYVSLGVTLDARLQDDCGNTYLIGDQVNSASYNLIVKVKQPEDNGFSNRNNFVVNKVTLYDANGIISVIETVDGCCSSRIKLESGILQLTAEGSVNGQQARLLIATPFFVK